MFIKRIWASFVKIDLEPLPDAVCMEMINYFLDNYNLRIIDRELYRREILKSSNGNPFHIKNMLWHGSREKYIDTEEIRKLRQVDEGHYFQHGTDLHFRCGNVHDLSKSSPSEQTIESSISISQHLVLSLISYSECSGHSFYSGHRNIDRR